MVLFNYAATQLIIIIIIVSDNVNDCEALIMKHFIKRPARNSKYIFFCRDAATTAAFQLVGEILAKDFMFYFQLEWVPCQSEQPRVWAGSAT